MKPKVTVFTPTYNRGYILETLYRSLQRQTCMDFEWLVVDDGSSDNTLELFAQWMAEGNPFPIRYEAQPNGGKHRAINRGLELAEGEWFFTVDSDDYLTDDAVEKISSWLDMLPENGAYCGVSGNIGTSPLETPNRLFEAPYADATLLERYGKVDGERAMVFSTKLHRAYLYPEFTGENFMTEAVAWNRMAADGYKMRFYNDIIWVYEYLPDGLTKAGNKVFLNNPQGHGLWLREKAEFLGEPWYRKLVMYYSFFCDHAFHLTQKKIAAYIGAPGWVIRMCAVVFGLKHRRR